MLFLKQSNYIENHSTYRLLLALFLLNFDSVAFLFAFLIIYRPFDSVRLERFIRAYLLFSLRSDINKAICYAVGRGVLYYPLPHIRM